MDSTITFTVNGERKTVTTDSARPLLDVLREDLRLTGTKYGCGEGKCGSCTVLVDGKRTFSCRTDVEAASGKTLTTIEGIAANGVLHPVQQAFLEEGASQCGYCTPGMVMAAVALMRDKPTASDDEIVAWMNGNVCRCCNYVNILSAVKHGLRGAAASAAEPGRQQ
jgi:aerobic-type carbon monoxide dehydrogenase small subunit (CoxS/CutS family)